MPSEAAWRIQARYETECPRCMDWIVPGQWIAADEEFGGAYTHCVCPCDAAKPKQPTEPVTVVEYRPVYDADGNHIGMQEVTVLTEEEF